MSVKKTQYHSRIPDIQTFKTEVRKYCVSDTRKAIVQIFTSVIPYLALWYLMVLSLQTHSLVTIALACVAAGFMIRIFIIQHDCGHGSFFSSRKANALVGTICGIITLTPYRRWKKSHNRHHVTSSDLSRRGEGDVWTLTVNEYRELPLMKRFWYRVYRSPLVMFVFGGPYVTLIRNRFPFFDKDVMFTNSAVVIVLTVVAFLIGWKAMLFIQLSILIIATNAGVWLFYVQHQFVDTYWETHDEWDYIRAATDGSSFYKLPRVFQWFSGNIGFHHLHHLNPRIPNYLLPQAHYSLPFMEFIPVMTFLTSLDMINKTLWDEKNKKLVSFRQAGSL